jgi:hypothetical protein
MKLLFAGHALLPNTELQRLFERVRSAEEALMVLTAGLAREDDISQLTRCQHLHGEHLDVVEARIDKATKDMKAVAGVHAQFISDHNKRILALEKPKRKKGK